jgi:predicted TIM-barrel fold metal-dependent hydrolase
LSTRTLSDRYVVVSSDMHAGADLLAYKSYLPTRWHEEFDAWAASFYDPWTKLGAVTGDLRMGNASGGDRRNWASDERLADLDREGIAAEVIFPNTSPPFFPSGTLTATAPRTRDEFEHRWAGLQAHNRWLAEFCAQVPGRRAGIAQILLNDVDAAVTEIEWAHRHGLTGGILLPGVAPNTEVPPLYSEVYEPIWEACARLDVPINVHGSMAYGEVSGRVPVELQRSIDSVEAPFFCQRALWHLIISGVFERHPAIKFVMTEQNGIGWVSARLTELDHWFRSSQNDRRGRLNVYRDTLGKLSMLPSDYYKRNCHNGASFLVPREIGFRRDIGVDRIMWGADYPHSEGTFPYTRAALRATFSNVPEAECRMMLGETAALVYGFDLSLLRTVADRIGPAVSDVASPLMTWPSQPDETVCPVFSKEAVRS